VNEYQPAEETHTPSLRLTGRGDQVKVICSCRYGYHAAEYYPSPAAAQRAFLRVGMPAPRVTQKVVLRKAIVDF
jgi:hypothetical protein